jgi:hypothetical protein
MRLRIPMSVVCALLLTAFSTAAQQFTPYGEIERKSAIFEPRPSFDTAPVTIRIVSVVYRIPRNYLSVLEPAIPTLKLSWPGLEPLTPENEKCFGTIAQSERAGCTSFSFLMLGSRGTGTGGRALTNSEMFENFRKGTRALTSTGQRGPLDYDIYSIGPEESRIEGYRKVDGDIFFTCQFSGPESRKRGGVCDDMFRLDDMNHLQFYFRLHQIEHVPDIEDRMRKIMAEFVIKGD